MKSNKGFTLIELLAVIVVLAIIALIATPMVLNTIDEAKKGAAKNSAYAYIHAVEMKIAMDMVGTDSVSGDATITDATYASVKGDKPSSEGLSLVFSDGIIQPDSTITVNNYKFKVGTDGKLTDAPAANTEG